MSDKKYPNSGALFKNDRKTKDTHPDYTGQGEVHGIDTWFSGWIKESKSGKKFISLTFKAKDEVTGEVKTSTVNVPVDDEVPF